MFAGNLSLIRDNFDPAAQAYIDAVEAADGQPLEAEVKRAITRFVKDCKADGIWNAIKASCILAGARTLTGALVPLVGTAPTNFNFVSGDYNRKTGLKGNASNKYLDSNRLDDADPTDSTSVSVYVTERQSSSSGRFYLCARNSNATSTVQINTATGNTTSLAINIRSSNFGTINYGSSNTLGLIGGNRSSSSSFLRYANGATNTQSATATAPNNLSYFIFAANQGSMASPTDGRLSFYHIGESLDLALLDARLATLMNAFNRYIP